MDGRVSGVDVSPISPFNRMIQLLPGVPGSLHFDSLLQVRTAIDKSRRRQIRYPRSRPPPKSYPHRKGRKTVRIN